MPGRDRTGPQGAGPRTGRGLGDCGGTPARPAFGFGGGYGSRGGFGRGRGGMGCGWRSRFYATGIPGWVSPTPEQEVADLKAQADLMKGQLEAVEKRIEELTSG